MTNVASPLYVSIKGAAVRYDVSTDLIRDMVRDGRLPHVRFGRVIRIPLSALTPDELSKANTKQEHETNG
jgi:excisionase family DNA binding protein